MNAFSVVENYFATRGVGIGLLQDIRRYKDYQKVGNISFCQAVRRARSGPVRIKKDLLSCPGARFVFGVAGAGPAPIINALVQNRNMNTTTAKKTVGRVVRLEKAFEWIVLHRRLSKVNIFFFTPEKTMRLLTLFQTTGERLTVDLSSIMALCGEITVRTLVSEKTTFSFGCRDSRKYSGIKNHELVIGMPKNKIMLLAKIIKAADP